MSATNAELARYLRGAAEYWRSGGDVVVSPAALIDAADRLEHCTGHAVRHHAYGTWSIPLGDGGLLEHRASVRSLSEPDDSLVPLTLGVWYLVTSCFRDGELVEAHIKCMRPQEPSS